MKPARRYRPSARRNGPEAPDLSIGIVLAFAFIANYSGLSSTLALLLAGRKGFPFFSPYSAGSVCS